MRNWTGHSTEVADKALAVSGKGKKGIDISMTTPTTDRAVFTHLDSRYGFLAGTRLGQRLNNCTDRQAR
jgi:hypothetical protein